MEKCKEVLHMLTCRVFGHKYGDGVYLGATGKLCFSFNCARSQVATKFTCERCGDIKLDTAMSGVEIFELTPEVCAKVLEDEFGIENKEKSQ